MKVMETIGKRIKSLREAVGMTQQSFADAITAQLKLAPIDGQPDTVSRGAVGNWELDKPVGMRSIRAISARFNVAFDWLMNGSGPAPTILSAPSEDAPRAALPDFRTSALMPADYIPPSQRPWIDMRGSARGSIVHSVEGVLIEAEVVDRIPCPPHLAGVKGIYGIYVEGDSMSPAHNPGEPRIVHPGRPVMPGDTVVVQTRRWDDDPGQGYIKIFRRRKGNSIILEQLNPQVTIEIPVQYVTHIHHVLTMAEVLGF